MSKARRDTDNAARVLARLAEPGALLAPLAHGSGFGIFPRGDRRRRPLLRVSEQSVRQLQADGAITRSGEHAFTLTPAGEAHAARARAAPDEAYLAQHAEILDRPVMDADGDERIVRGYAPEGALHRLTKLRDSNGAPWLSRDEIEAARRLRADYELGQVALVRGSDWLAPPKSGASRGPGGGREGALAMGLDARTRTHAALEALAPPLRRAVTALCLEDQSLQAFERRENCSAKTALKLALAQLAAHWRNPKS